MAYQLRLSHARAVAVRDGLVGLGIDPARLTVAGVGSREPAVPEWPGGVHDLAAAQKNRRVVVTVTGGRP